MTNERIEPARFASRAGALLWSLLLVLSVAVVEPLDVKGALNAVPVPVEAPAAAPPAAPATIPGIQHEEALAHAADPNVFTPGTRATVPLRSRPGAVGTTKAAPTSATPRDHAPVPESVPSAKALAASSGLRREVFGFLPYWEVADPSAVINYSVLSTIAYFSVGVDRSGNLVKSNSDGTTSTGWAGWTSSRLTSVINTAHQNGVRVVLCLTLFAWSTSEAATQSAFLGDPIARANLAAQAAQAVADRGADGINLDFEPIAAGRADEYTALVQAVRTQLDAVVPGAQLTFDTTADIGNYPIQAATAPGGADAIFIMGYDLRTAGAPAAGSIAPLNGPKYDIGDALQAYLAQVPASKLILGVAVVRPGLVHGVGRAKRGDADRHEIRQLKRGLLLRRHRVRERQRPSLRRRRAERLDRVPARQLLLDVWLRDDVAGALLRRRPVTRGEIRPRQSSRASRRGDVGPRL